LFYIYITVCYIVIRWTQSTNSQHNIDDTRNTYLIVSTIRQAWRSRQLVAIILNSIISEEMESVLTSPLIDHKIDVYGKSF